MLGRRNILNPQNTLCIWLFWEFSGRDKNTVQARRASECIVQFQGMHLLAPRACILGVFIKQLGLSGIQATEVSLSNLPIEATKTREEPCILALAETVNVYPLLVRVNQFLKLAVYWQPDALARNAC